MRRIALVLTAFDNNKNESHRRRRASNSMPSDLGAQHGTALAHPHGAGVPSPKVQQGHGPVSGHPQSPIYKKPDRCPAIKTLGRKATGVRRSWPASTAAPASLHHVQIRALQLVLASRRQACMCGLQIKSGSGCNIMQDPSPGTAKAAEVLRDILHQRQGLLQGCLLDLLPQRKAQRAQKTQNKETPKQKLRS